MIIPDQETASMRCSSYYYEFNAPFDAALDRDWPGIRVSERQRCVFSCCIHPGMSGSKIIPLA